MKGAGDILGQTLNFVLLCALGVFVVEGRQDVFLVKPVEQLALARHRIEQLRDLVRHVGPARRQHVHLDDVVAAYAGRRCRIVVESAGREETLAVLAAAAARG